LEISVHLGHLRFDEILVTSDNELLSVVLVIVWGVHEEAELGNLSAVTLLIFEVVNCPSASKYMRNKSGLITWSCSLA
jgi:hypothetical protein